MVRSASAGRLVYYGIYFSAASFVQWMAVKAGFGVPAFIAICILCICTVGVGERWTSEASAYSVFNKGGTRLAGTLTAEQLDAQMRSAGQARAESASLDHTDGVHTWGRGAKLSSGSRSSALDPLSVTTARQQADDQARQRRASVVAAAAQARVSAQSSID